MYSKIDDNSHWGWTAEKGSKKVELKDLILEWTDYGLLFCGDYLGAKSKCSLPNSCHTQILSIIGSQVASAIYFPSLKILGVSIRTNLKPIIPSALCWHRILKKSSLRSNRSILIIYLLHDSRSTAKLLTRTPAMLERREKRWFPGSACKDRKYCSVGCKTTQRISH